LEIEHPAAKILVDLAELQDQEVGDGTTSVVSFSRANRRGKFFHSSSKSIKVIIAAELLKNADSLVKQKIHPTSIISGYRVACKYVGSFYSKLRNFFHQASQSLMGRSLLKSITA
jgi:T-complex protein 1 subunit alpha